MTDYVCAARPSGGVATTHNTGALAGRRPARPRRDQLAVRIDDYHRPDSAAWAFATS
jgi:hypothetical protein